MGLIADEAFRAKAEAAGHTLTLDEDGDIDWFAMDCDVHNGPSCSVCGESWCHHCDDEIEPCDGGKAQREAEVAGRIARAAPDLLAALTALLDHDEQDAGCLPTDAHLDARKDARAAIAKAKGG